MGVLTPIKTTYEPTPVGAYKTTFTEFKDVETVNGLAYRWTFTADDGRIISDLSDGKTTFANKTGRWLAALTGKPLQENVNVNTDDYIGQRYLVIVEPKPNATNGETRIATFTKI